VARCKVYEIQGSDAERTAGAVRCHREATGAKIKLDDRKYPVCKRHHGDSWRLFVTDGWLYAVAVGKGTKRRNVDG
jgi:hypothetical protein